MFKNECKLSKKLILLTKGVTTAFKIDIIKHTKLDWQYFSPL